MTDEEFQEIIAASKKRTSILEVPEGVHYPLSTYNGYRPTAVAYLPDGGELVVQDGDVVPRLLTVLHFKGYPTCKLTDKAGRQPLAEMRYGAPTFIKPTGNYLGLAETLDIDDVLKAANGKIRYKKKRLCQGCGKQTRKAAQAHWCNKCKPKQRALDTRNCRARKREK